MSRTITAQELSNLATYYAMIGHMTQSTKYAQEEKELQNEMNQD